MANNAITGRLWNLWTGFLALWVTDIEKEHPEIAYQNSIQSMIEKYGKLKAASGRIIARKLDVEGRLQTAKAELAKPEPNFERLLNMREEFSELSANERKVAISEWVRFTQMLTAEQKALVKGQLLDRVSRAENLREKFRQRHGG